MENNKILNALKDGEKTAEAVIENPQKRDKLIEKVENFASNNRSSLQDYWQDIELTFSLLKDYFSGVYKEVALSSIVMIISSFLFIVSPFRFLPKWLPLSALLERTLVIIFILEYIKGDLAAYRKWRQVSAEQN